MQKAATKNQQFELEEVTITGNEEISPGVHLISWMRICDFSPGQVVKIAADPMIAPRIYSICSGNDEPEIRVLFNVKEDGLLTPWLAGVIPGMKIWVSKPYGSFKDDKKPAWWIATGTGIAPFYSMFRSGIADNKILIHGVRKLDQFYFEDELEWAMGDRYVRCCSQEQSCNVFPGRVNKYLEEIKELPTDINYYLCGKAIMVVEVRDLLISRGIPYENILAEIYF
ncbi:ferredoxin--NADP(+) reductase [Aquipluma nitroreducens]|uniref:Ferredoxin--NADP(+) reductase n=1 Tax=Aquipluma nitroreducens TaxID=2010828 RepID=A0A5K7S730_9BACT|nr:FAD-dependent oxidoreductase [Aquipluma nitroreducens]BBE17307.1 ferredoxin--NADP(+) reductase [Aquipluma nitroreducens]